MRIHAVATFAAAACSMLAFTEAASARSADDVNDYIIPDQVSILGVTHAGSGCPVIDGTSTVGASISQDFQVLTVAFDQYLAEVGPGLDMRHKRLFCHIVLDLGFPAGLSFALIDLNYAGWADLEPGIKADQTSSYYFQGFQQDAKYTFRTTLVGGEFGYLGPFFRTDTLAAVSWSPCDKKRGLNIVTSVALDNRWNRRGSGTITLDSIETKVTETYGMRWRRCA